MRTRAAMARLRVRAKSRRGGDVDGDVVEPDSVGRHRFAGAGFEHDEHLAARAQFEPVGGAINEGEADDVAPDGKGAFGICDRDMDLSQMGPGGN